MKYLILTLTLMTLFVAACETTERKESVVNEVVDETSIDEIFDAKQMMVDIVAATAERKGDREFTGKEVKIRGTVKQVDFPIDALGWRVHLETNHKWVFFVITYPARFKSLKYKIGETYTFHVKIKGISRGHLGIEKIIGAIPVTLD